MTDTVTTDGWPDEDGIYWMNVVLPLTAEAFQLYTHSKEAVLDAAASLVREAVSTELDAAFEAGDVPEEAKQ